MLSRTVRRTLLDSRYTLPPTFLLPWAASLSTLTAATELQIPPSPLTHAQSHYSPVQEAISLPHKRVAASSADSRGADESSRAPLHLSQSVKELLPVLRAQGQIYLSAHIHGKAYLVTQGDTVRLPFLMKDVEPGDTIRLNRALYLGSRDLTLKSAAALPKFKRDDHQESVAEIVVGDQESSALTRERAAPHFIPHIAKDKHAYLDERLFVCRATVTGVESEPLRVLEKTKRRQRHVKHVKSKHRYTILKIAELRVCNLDDIESGIE